MSQAIEDMIEAAYWDFDALHKGYNRPKGLGPMDERMAFKTAVRLIMYAVSKDFVPSKEKLDHIEAMRKTYFHKDNNER